MTTSTNRDVYESSQQVDVADNETPPSRTRDRSHFGASRAGGGLSTSDERFLRMKEEGDSKTSGVFEGVAGTGADASYLTTSITGGYPEDPFSSGPSPAADAYEFFRGKSFKSINYEQGFASVNKYLRQQTRTEFTFEGRGSELESSDDELVEVKPRRQLSRASTLKKLEALSDQKRDTSGLDLETPIEKVNRLQIEVTEMIDFISAFIDSRQHTAQPKDQVSDSSLKVSEAADEEARRFFGADPVALMNELKVLKTYLLGVSQSDTFNRTVKPSKAKDAPAAATEESMENCIQVLLKHLGEAEVKFQTKEEPSKQVAVKKEDTKKGPPGPPSAFTYEIYGVPDPTQVVDSVRIGEMEKRLADVEVLLGLQKNLHLSLPFPDISSGLKEVVSRLYLVDPQRLDSMGKRIQTLTTQLDDLLQRKERLAAIQQKSTPTEPGTDVSGVTEEDKCISDLYDFYEQSRPIFSNLPIIIRRLKTLKQLHQEAASVGSRLNALETQQAELSQLLSSAQSSFTSLRENVLENFRWTRDIVKSLKLKTDSNE